ncbi:MOXD1 homolog 1 [Agrilus planipennis]|uniref:MOXD1 homolog 1 n=1 Tax=Agrilus planipennis TaxID=224129 RepID=A0A1W4XC79_AGRPL|nr:MOXD1 homolog 1 [Agrilus planipennis]XP_018333731.1 MOXD1 homolog 1 [Agrilus planipennis]
MERHLTLLLLLTLSYSCGCLSSRDLLDQYVAHIEEINNVYTHDSQRHLNLDFQDHSAINNHEASKHKLDSFRQNDDRVKRDAFSYDFNQWTHSAVLDKNGKVLLRWQPRHQEISFRIEAATRGYIGLGFSPNGGMEGADIVLGWIDDNTGKAYLLDCHAGPRSQGSAPIRDEISNYRLLSGSHNDTHTMLEFRRALDTCDPDDFVLGSDTVKVIWALHDIDPSLGAEMVYHGSNRGSQSVHLIGPPQIPKQISQTRNWDVTLKNFEVKEETTYWCKVFKAPVLQQKHHVVSFEPLIGPNHTQHVHHMLLHECVIDYTIPSIEKWEKFATEIGRPCYANEMPPEWERCLTPLVAWAVGSNGETLPEHVGLPLSPRTPSFYMLEVHFDNPSMKKSVDTSGLRLQYTNKLRPNEGGVMVTGITISPLHFIPPLQNEYKSAGYCSVDCTREVMPKAGINVVSVLLHSHLAGRKLKLRHIRGGKELPPIVQDDHYDFNYQQSRALSHEVTILPGDGLVTECTYSTLDRKKPTLGGYSTREEMCLAFVLHYPRTQLAGCYSMPPIRYFFKNLGVNEFYNMNMTEIEGMFLHGLPDSTAAPLTSSTSLFPPYKAGDENSIEANQKAILALQNAKEFTEGESAAGFGPFDNLIIKAPNEFKNKSFMSHLRNIPFNETLLTKRIEEYFYTGLHLTFCRRRNDTLALPEKVETFPNFTAYEDDLTNKILCSYRTKLTGEKINAATTIKLHPMFLLFCLVQILRHLERI